MDVKGSGTKEDPWVMKTRPGKSEYLIWKDESADPPALMCKVGATVLGYHLRGLEDCHAMLKAHGDWMELGNKDEGKDTKEGPVEHWARAADNPLGGYYGIKKGLRGRITNYVTPVMEMLGMVELEHNAHNNRVRAI